MLRPMREALALEVGVQYNSILFSAVLVVLGGAAAHLLVAGRADAARPAAVVRVYAVRARVPRAGRRRFTGSRAIATLAFVYFVALTSANLYVISVFWSAMADVWRPELAKRFYGYVAAGGSAGALLGPLIVTVAGAQHRRRRRSSSSPAPSSCARRGLVSLARRSLRRSAERRSAVPDAAIPVGGRAFDDLARLARTPYLLGIAGVIIAGQTIGAFMYNEQGEVRRRPRTPRWRIAPRSSRDMELAVNLLSLFFQAVVVTWLTRRGSVALSLSAMPVLIGGEFHRARAVSGRQRVPGHAGIAARGGLRPRQAAARDAVHRAEPREQVQEQEPDRYSVAARRRFGRAVAVRADRRHRPRRDRVDLCAGLCVVAAGRDAHARPRLRNASAAPKPRASGAAT